MKILWSIIKKCFRLLLNGWIPGALLVALGIYMFINREGEDTRPATQLREYFLKNRPGDTAELEKLKARYGNADMNAGVRFYQSQYGKDALRKFAEDIAEGHARPILELSQYIRQNGGKLSQEQSSYMDIMCNAAFGNPSKLPDSNPISPSGRQASRLVLDNYADALKKAQEEGGETAEVVANSPASAWVYYMLCMNPDTASRQTWDTYCRYKEWMPDAVSILYATPIEDGTPIENAICTFIQNCAKYPTMGMLVSNCVKNWRSAAEKNEAPASDDELSEATIAAFHIPAIADIYKRYGGVLESIGKDCSMPEEQILDFVLLNKTMLEQDIAKKEESRFIADAQCIWNITAQHEKMRRELMETPEILALFRATSPEHFVAALCKHDITQMCPGLLYICSDEETGALDTKALGNAMLALEKYGEMAIQTFKAQKDDPQFRTALARDWRSVAYLGIHEDGISNLMKNNWKGHIDKEFEQDGTPKGESSLQYIPVGSLVELGKNLIHGYPCELSELGWAAYDLVEGGMFIAASVSTGGGGIAAKSAMGTLKASIKGSGKFVAKSYAKDVGKAAAKMAAKRESRALTRKAGSLAMRRLIVQGGKLFAKSLRITKRVGKSAARGMGSIMRNPKALRVTAAAMLGFEILVRTVPHLEDIAKGVTSFVIKIFSDTAKGFMNGICEAGRNEMEELKASLSPAFIAGIAAVALILGLILLVIKILSLFSINKRRTPPQYT